jgi:cell filamentation protein
MPFDPFGDHDTRGYLRNFAVEKDPERVRRLEHHAFAANVLPALAMLQDAPRLGYGELLDTHRVLFGSLYPWAGQDRAVLAPTIAIARSGAADLFAHPADVRRAAEYGLDMARDPAAMRARPGEVFGVLAYAHPFHGNGRTLMTVHADLARRAGFHIAWQDIAKAEFLPALTTELRQPGRALDKLLAPHIRPGPLPTAQAATGLRTNPGLTSVSGSKSGPSGPG